MDGLVASPVLAVDRGLQSVYFAAGTSGMRVRVTQPHDLRPIGLRLAADHEADFLARTNAERIAVADDLHGGFSFWVMSHSAQEKNSGFSVRRPLF